MLDKNSISKAIDNLRLPMAIMVVAIHCYFFNSLNINALPSKWGGGGGGGLCVGINNFFLL